MERYQVILAYDGTGFYGSQRQASQPQPLTPHPRTVQAELEKALLRIGWEGKSILLAGRTDTGTHASGQVAAFDLEWQHGSDELVRALNAWLPSDLAVRSARIVAGGFHPRFDAVSRTYRYRIYCAEQRDPLRERFAWRVSSSMADLAPLASLWLGAHDFAAFGTPPRKSGSSVRTVFHASWQACADEWLFEVQADAFLYRMVRRLVYVQVVAGQGRLQTQALADALQHPLEGRAALPAGLAPACGLTLAQVTYANLDRIRLLDER